MVEPANGRVFIHIVDRDGVIVSVNDEWLAFARENDAPELVRKTVEGRPLWDFMDGMETRHISRLLFEKARNTGKTLIIPYRCDSPGIRRFLEMEIAPMVDGTVAFRSRYLKYEPRDPVRFLDRGVGRTSEFLTLCSWCRRARVGDEWVELEDAIGKNELFSTSSLPQLTHGICQDCNKLVHKKTD